VVPSHDFPPEAYQLAARYHLGTPQFRHSRDGKITDIFYALIFLIVGGGLFIPFALKANWPNLSDIVILVIIGIPCALALVLPTLLLIRRWVKNLHYYAYECSEGFIELRQPGSQVVQAIRWDDVYKVQKEFKNWRLNMVFYITHWQGRVDRIYYSGIWHKCQEEILRRPHQEQQWFR